MSRLQLSKSWQVWKTLWVRRMPAKSTATNITASSQVLWHFAKTRSIIVERLLEKKTPATKMAQLWNFACVFLGLYYVASDSQKKTRSKILSAQKRWSTFLVIFTASDWFFDVKRFAGSVPPPLFFFFVHYPLIKCIGSLRSPQTSETNI